jgi:uncharacterized protein YbjT (DUF2867 family)/uncharacterized membrane protein YphA (DoxX/SURF4 family)
MRVLVTGAAGFIGARVVAALRAAGHVPVAAVRAGTVLADVALDRVDCDLAHDLEPAHWRLRLRGIEAVVNCAGILRERGAATHARVGERAPIALFQACVEAGIDRVVQVSALGDPADGAFVAAKHRADAALLALPLAGVVLRPSLVFAADGAYGGSSLLRALAVLPVLALPGGGRQPLQPVAIDDVAAAVVAVLATQPPLRGCIELVGPQVLGLRDYLLAWRRWLGAGAARTFAVPMALVRAVAAVGELAGRGPLGTTMARMLERGSVGADGAAAATAALLGRPAQSLTEALARRPASSADRWHARLYLLAPLLRFALALTWIASGVVGFLLPAAQVQTLFTPVGLGDGAAFWLSWAASATDIVLGVLLLAGRAPRRVLAAMALMVLAYSAYIIAFLPAAWLDPFGGLLKNAVILVAIAIAAATAERS